MTMNTPDPASESRPSPDEPDAATDQERSECRECDPRHFAGRHCRSAGIEAEAKYIQDNKADLEKAQADYDATRKAYRLARQGVTLQVQDLRHQIRHLVDRVRCLIQQDRVVDCLDRAYRCIVEQLDECSQGSGCCVDDACVFDTECPREWDELLAKIARYQAHLDYDKKCFATLVGEPQALTKRVAGYKAEVDAVSAALLAEAATTDLKSVYAQALVAQRHLQLVWNGFPETKDFLDCLCRVYDCWISASDAVAVLTGCQGVQKCHRDAQAEHCASLAAQTAEAIVLEYERICSCEPCDSPPKDDNPPKGDDACECDHGHRHQRTHHDHDHEHREHEHPGQGSGTR